MRILMVLTYYYPHWTGLTTHPQWVAENLVQRGHRVTVLTSRFRPDLPLCDRHNGVDIVRLPTLLRLSRGVVMPSFAGAVARLVREHDVVQINTPMLEAPLVVWLARRAGKKTLVTHHGDLVMPAGLYNQFVELIVTALMRQALRWAPAISSYSRDYAENSRFLRPFLHKVTCIYPPIQIPQPDADRAVAWRRELGLEGQRIVGFAGRWVEEKGFDYLLQAVPRVVEQVPGTRFAFAGERNVVYEKFYARCRHLVERNNEHVLFMGLLTDRQKLAAFYRMCDVFALPSRTDCFAMVQVEAMLCGTPVVATDIPGARVPVRETGMGLLVRPHDPEALAEGLVEVLRAPERYRRTPDEVRRVFSTERTVTQYEQLLQRLAS
ncbi:MAG: glycosyltransferase family 4 protein [Anaerolineae bacterium]|nr:glycosyltransferase family 4 protein [Anaerolineae bacterium]